MDSGFNVILKNMIASILGLAVWSGLSVLFGFASQWLTTLPGALTLLGLLVSLLGICFSVIGGTYAAKMLLKSAPTRWGVNIYYLLVALSAMYAASTAEYFFNGIMMFVVLGILVFHDIKLNRMRQKRR